MKFSLDTANPEENFLNDWEKARGVLGDIKQTGAMRKGAR